MKRSRFSYYIALTLVLMMTLSTVPVRVRADEGMFMPDAVSKLNWAELTKRGMKLKPTDIYNPNGVSYKDAIVRVEIGPGGFGTGEFVSPNGLLLTNHHVAFDALVAASTPEKNYGELGYKANSMANELPAKDYAVRMTLEIKDVTSDVMSVVKEGMSAQERNAAIRKKVQEIEDTDPDSKRENEGIQVSVERMTEGLFYYKFKYQSFRDVRIVYAPPKSIGYFGGDPDNFEWPRHCGDFTFMRVYTAPDGKPADFSTSNIPYKPKKYMTLSTAGIKENDFVFVMGYPGGTRRYRESYSINFNQNYNLPRQIEDYSTQISILQNIGKYDPAKRVELQSQIFNLSNSLKAWEGDVLALRRSNLIQRKKDEEVAFNKWLDADPKRKAKYGDALPNISKAYQELLKTEAFNNAVANIYGSGLIPFVALAYLAAAEREKPEAQQNKELLTQAARAKGQIAFAAGSRLIPFEREMLKFYLRKAAELPAGQKIEAVEKRFGNLKGEARIRAEEELARAITESKLFNADQILKLFDMTTTQMNAANEPIVSFAVELDAENDKAQLAQIAFNQAVQQWRPLFYEGMREMHGIKYPDANATMRFTYGNVKGYIPREAMIYQPFTYLFGTVEKDTGQEPFNVPEKLKQLYRDKDFGTYADPAKKDVPANFLSTTDIIGGNSGSPIMNGKGEQIGIVFDGNYEGLGNDFFFNPERGRTISVDIRYVLFLTEKFGGADWVLKELTIKGKK
jgi:hypothetical protein